MCARKQLKISTICSKMPGVVPRPLRRTAGVSLASHVSWPLLKARLTAACAAPKAPNTTQRRTPSTKDTLFATFHMNSRQQIIVTTNTNNLQGVQTLDINKDILDTKESPCWMWLLGCVGATARPQGGAFGARITRLDIWTQSTGSLSRPQPDRRSAISKWLHALAPGVFVFTPSPGPWALGRGCLRGSAHLLTEEGNLRTKATPAPCPHSSSFLLPLFLLLLVRTFLPASFTCWHFKNSEMHPAMDAAGPSLLIHRKVLHSITPPKHLRRVFFLSSWGEAMSQAPAIQEQCNPEEQKSLKRWCLFLCRHLHS